MRLSIRLFTALMGLLLILPIPSSEFTRPDPSSSVAPVSVEPPQLEWTEEDLLKPPNIIFVLSETFWDATRMTNLTFSRDPIPFFSRAAEAVHPRHHAVTHVRRRDGKCGA